MIQGRSVQPERPFYVMGSSSKGMDTMDSVDKIEEKNSLLYHSTLNSPLLTLLS